MADIDLTVQDINRTSGLVATYLDSSSATAISATDDYFVNNNGRAFLHVKNGATDVVVTIHTPNTVDGLAVADRAVTVTANTEAFIGPFQPNVYNGADHQMSFEFDDVSNVSVAVVRV